LAGRSRRGCKSIQGVNAAPRQRTAGSHLIGAPQRPRCTDQRTHRGLSWLLSRWPRDTCHSWERARLWLRHLARHSGGRRARELGDTLTLSGPGQSRFDTRRSSRLRIQFGQTTHESNAICHRRPPETLTLAPGSSHAIGHPWGPFASRMIRRDVRHGDHLRVFSDWPLAACRTTVAEGKPCRSSWRFACLRPCLCLSQAPRISTNSVTIRYALVSACEAPQG
jgi:hypothetical protein